MKKTVLITGASTGIGLALAEKLLNQGAIVIGTSRSGVIDLQHKNFHALALDLTNPSSIESAHQEILAKFETINILINNAGVGPDLDTHWPEMESFAKTFSVNVTGTVFFTEPLIARIPHEGIIVNISSKMGSIAQCVTTDSVAYRMSKSALNMYSKILTNRLKGVPKIVSIHPGWVQTEITENSKLHARLTPQESATNILNFIQGDFKSGTFWDSESGVELPW